MSEEETNYLIYLLRKFATKDSETMVLHLVNTMCKVINKEAYMQSLQLSTNYGYANELTYKIVESA